MEEDGQTTPFWAQTTTYFNSTKNRRRGGNPLSFCLNSGVLMALLLIIAMITILFVIPSLLSFTSQVFRPNLVRKSWDNLNLVLVLFAILCGILGRKKDDGIASNAVQVPEEPVQPQWFVGYSEKDNEMVNNPKVQMKRNSSSYPDLRQESSWAFPDDNWRSFDDNYAYNHRLESNYAHRPRYRQQDSGVKTIPVDTYVIQQEPSSPPPQSPPARQARRTFQSVAQKENSDIKEMEFTKIQSPPPLPPHSLYTPPTRQARRTFQSVAQKENSDIKDMKFPPPPPPPSEPRTNRSDKEVRRSERKKSGGAKEMATTLASLYNSRKRKMKQKSKENFDDIFPSPVYLQPVPAAFPPPPSPPPPPPTSKFQQLFKKGIKTKRIRSVSVSSSKQQPPPPPPPPPPPMSPLRTYKHKTHRQRPMTQPPPPPPPPPMSPLHTYKHKTHRQRPMTQPPPPPSEFPRPTEPMTPDRPPLPSKLDIFYNESSSSVNQAPSIPMPPPPPQPPFKVSGFKFVVEGDYVRLQSIQSSRSNSPDLDSTDTPPTSTPATPTSGGTEPVVSVFCPSPDVNTKADTFIARFRAGLRMEKAKSFDEKQVMGNSVPTQTSNLMPK